MNTDWQDVAAGLDDVGCAPTGPLLSPGERAEIAALFDREERFRSTVDMARHRFGSGRCVSTVRTGTRHALGLVLHDAA